VRPKKQQESKETKKVIKEKVDIKSMHVGISRFRKGNNGAVLIGYEAGKDLETLKIRIDCVVILKSRSRYRENLR